MQTLLQNQRWVFFCALLLTLNSLLAQYPTQIVGDRVNIRACAGVQCQVVNQLNNGMPCRVLSREAASREGGYGLHHWYKISFQGGEGFVFGAFLNLKDIVNPSNQLALTVYVPSSEETVNVRSCGALHCPIVFKINRGDQLRAIAKTEPYPIQGLGNKGWYKIQYQGQEGFVHASLVEERQSASSGPPVVPVSIPLATNNRPRSGTVTGDQVNIRAGAGTNYPVLFQLDLGTRCTIQSVLPTNNSQDYPWYKIECQGQTGYVSGQFFTVPNTGRSSKIWAVVVGIADYSSNMNQSGATDLNYSAQDAKTVYQFLKHPEGGALPDNQITLLRNEEASVRNIVNQCRRIYSQADEDDLIFFYFSGHGGPNYFAAYDRAIRHQEISEILSTSKADKRVCVADACFSGTWSKSAQLRLQGQTKLSDPQITNLYYNSLAAAGSGIAFLMSSEKDETSLEASNLGQGLFTHFYLKGLKGAADTNMDRVVTLQELYLYSRREVSNYAMRYFSHLQTPILNGSYDINTPMGIVRR